MRSPAKGSKSGINPRADDLPRVGVMAVFAFLVIGGAVVLGALVLWRQHERNIGEIESSRVEEELRAGILAAYRSLCAERYAEALELMADVDEKMAFLRVDGTGPHAYSDLRAASSIIAAELELARDPRAGAAEAERKFDAAMSLIRHASGEMWEAGVLGRARTRLELGKYREAASDLDLLLAGNPNYGAAYYWRSLAKHNLGDEKGAAADRERAEALGSWPPLRDSLVFPGKGDGGEAFF